MSTSIHRSRNRQCFEKAGRHLITHCLQKPRSQPRARSPRHRVRNHAAPARIKSHTTRSVIISCEKGSTTANRSRKRSDLYVSHASASFLNASIAPSASAFPVSDLFPKYLKTLLSTQRLCCPQGKKLNSPQGPVVAISALLIYCSCRAVAAVFLVEQALHHFGLAIHQDGPAKTRHAAYTSQTRTQANSCGSKNLGLAKMRSC